MCSLQQLIATAQLQHVAIEQCMLQLSNTVAGTASVDVLPRARGVQSLQSQTAFCKGHYTREILALMWWLPDDRRCLDNHTRRSFLRPFWMHSDFLNACVVASRSLTRQQVADTLRSLMPLVARGRTQIQALQCLEIAVPWNQPNPAM